MTKPYTVPVTRDLVRLLLDYDAETGVLTWRERPGSYQFNSAWAGKPAGWLHSDGYIVVRLFGRVMYAHTLAWLWARGTYPKDCLDHINGNPADNRIANLRPATHQQNCFNRTTHLPHGFRGIVPAKGKNNPRWCATISAGRVNRHVGTFDTKEEAARAYDTAARQFHGEFAILNFPDEPLPPPPAQQGAK